jgi:hypothetical protein
MLLTSLTPEEDELHDLLEGKRLPDLSRFRELIDLLMERHWHAFLAHVRRHCVDEGISAETIAVDTLLKAYEILHQQIAPHPHAPTALPPMVYSRTKCPQFLGFIKALAKWKPADEARKTRRYRSVLTTYERQTLQALQQYGSLRSHTNGKRVPFLYTDPCNDHTAVLWDLVRQLPSREYLVIYLYFQHGPDSINLQEFTELASGTGLAMCEVRTLQRRFRALTRKQPSESVCSLTQDQLAALFDVNCETIRRTIIKGKQHLQAALSIQ